MAVKYRSERRRKQVDTETGFTRGELDDLLEEAQNRFARANRVASHSVDTQGAKMSTVDQRARLEAARGSTPMNDRAERVKDPRTDDVRAYRKQKFGIDDLRDATAAQIEAARKDPLAFRRKPLARADENTSARDLAAAQAAAQFGSKKGGKPADYIGYPGGRRPPTGGAGPLAATLSLADQRKKLKRRGGPRQTIGAGGAD